MALLVATGSIVHILLSSFSMRRHPGVATGLWAVFSELNPSGQSIYVLSIQNYCFALVALLYTAFYAHRLGKLLVLHESAENSGAEELPLLASPSSPEETDDDE